MTLSDSITARMPAGEANIIALARFATESAESNAAAAATVKVRLRMTSSLGNCSWRIPNGMNQTLGTLVSHTAQNGDYRRTQTVTFTTRASSLLQYSAPQLYNRFLLSSFRRADCSCATTLPARQCSRLTNINSDLSETPHRGTHPYTRPTHELSIESNYPKSQTAHI